MNIIKLSKEWLHVIISQMASLCAGQVQTKWRGGLLAVLYGNSKSSGIS